MELNVKNKSRVVKIRKDTAADFTKIFSSQNAPYLTLSFYVSQELVVVYQPLQHDAKACLLEMKRVATIVFYHGDEVLRQWYRRWVLFDAWRAEQASPTLP